MSIFEKLMGGGHGRRHGGGHHERYDNSPPANQAETWGRAPQSAAVPTMACIACGTGNSPTARFCQQCGTSLIPVQCQGCNAEMLGGMKFCGKCGMERK